MEKQPDDTLQPRLDEFNEQLASGERRSSSSKHPPPSTVVPVSVAQGDSRTCTFCNVMVSRKNWARHCHTYHSRSEDTSVTHSSISRSNTDSQAEFLKEVEECTRSYMACLGAPSETLSGMIGQKIPSLNESTRNMFVKIVQTQIGIFRHEMFAAKSFNTPVSPSVQAEFPELCEVNMQMEDLSASARAISQEKGDKGREIPLEQLRKRYNTKKSSPRVAVPSSSAAKGPDRRRGDVTPGHDTRRPYVRDERPYHRQSRERYRHQQHHNHESPEEVLSVLKQLMDKFSR